MFRLMTKARFHLYKKAYLGLLREKNQHIQDLDAARKDIEQKLKTVEATLMVTQKRLSQSGEAMHDQGKVE